MMMRACVTSSEVSVPSWLGWGLRLIRILNAHNDLRRPTRAFSSQTRFLLEKGLGLRTPQR